MDVTGTTKALVVAGSRAGAEHDFRGTPREDAYATQCIVQGSDAATLAFAAVADGVGTARVSQLAAIASVAVAVEHLQRTIKTLADVQLHVDSPSARRRLSAELSEQFAQALTAQRIDELADDYGPLSLSPRVLHRQAPPASTVVFAAVAVGRPGLRGIIGVVGDAKAAVVDLAGGRTRWLTPSPAEDSERTAALPRHADTLDVSAFTAEPGHALLLMSDGMAEVLDARGDDVAAELSRLSAGDDETEVLRDLLDLPVQAAHDDRTLVAVIRR